MRRTLALAALVLVGLVLVLVVRAPDRPTGLAALRGQRVVRIGRAAVERVELARGAETLRARRVAGGWEVDGRRASAGFVDALDDLIEALTRLRAIDVFRARDGAHFGLASPRGQIVVATAHRTVALDLGDFNDAGSALYVRRARDPRVLLVGTTVMSAVERVFYQRGLVEKPAS